MDNKRRTFLQVGGKVAVGSLLLPHFACNNNTTTEDTQTEETVETASAEKLDQFGIQLYTLRDIIPDDPKGVLKQLADFGYTQIESYQHNKLGMYWGMSNTDFKAYLDDLGLNMVASHTDINKDFEKNAAEAAEIGVKYLICPYIGAQENMDAWKKVVDQFNACGDICKKNGIRFAYHNHAYSFEEIEGQIPQDYMMDNTNPDTVDFELDMYWVVAGGADPIAYFNKYPNRFRLGHVKDRMKGVSPEEREASCTLGTGSIDYAKILKVAKDQGMEYFLLEQERYDNTTPIECAKDGATYFKALELA